MEPVRVWGVRLGAGQDEAEGRLILESDALVFRMDEGDLRLPLADIRKAKRVRGSPVLTVEVAEDAGLARFAFFFVKPPSLQPQGRESKGRAKRRNAGFLAMQAPKHADELKDWERAIREAVAAQRS